MKRMKTLLSVILALTLALALTVPAFAAGEQIKVVDANVSAYDYAAYKIFDATVDANNDVSYTLPGTSVWVDELIVDTTANPLVSKFPGLEFTKNGSNYDVKKLMDFSSANFAAFLADAMTRSSSPITPTPIPVVKDSTTQTATFDVSGAAYGPGYYLITYGPVGDTIGSNPYALTTVLQGEKVTVQNKHDMPFDKDVLDASGASINEEGVQLGDVLTFEIKGKVPSVSAGDTFYYYYIKDTLSKGLEFDPNSFHVFIGANDITADLYRVTDYSATLVEDKYRFDERTPNEYTFDLSIDILTRSALAGQDIIVRYNATVTEDAAGTVVNNRANLTYGNDPSHLINKDAETRNYVSQIVIDKFETGNNAQKLSGAEFVLYRLATNEDVTAGAASNVGDKLFYRYNEATKTLTWITCADPTAAGVAVEHVDNASDATAITKVVTDSDGAAKFVGLKDGDYKLMEIAAPTGYVLLTDDVDVHVDGTAALDPSLTAEQQMVNLTHVANVANTPGSILPSTGGRGATMLYIAGLVLILVSGAYLVLRKRCEA